MSLLQTAVSINLPRVTYLHAALLIAPLWAMGPANVSAQDAGTVPCGQMRQAERASILGYVFKTYQGYDSGCFRIYEKGNVVYEVAEDEAYHLGQPSNPRLKIPAVPNGADVTGNGRPDMIVKAWSGGAHCCNTKYVFQLEPRLKLIAKIEDGDTDIGHFEKLPGDNTYHYVTYDIWSYWPASFAASVAHKVLLKWEGTKLKLDTDKMRFRAPTPEQWSSALKDVDDAVNSGAGEELMRDELGETLWDTTLDLIYTGHSDLAWKFVREANPKAFVAPNPSLEDFCSRLNGSPYWPDLAPTIQDMPAECKAVVDAKSK